MGYEKKLISVVVPVYNVEKYLERCIESLIAQTYDELEIILVDDGSTDSSGCICDEYAKQYENIIVIHKENGGLSSARNKGLDNARGEFIGFVDSDDWIHPNMYSILYELLVSNDADVSSAKYVFRKNEKKVDETDKGQVFVFQDREIVEFYLKYSYENKIGEYPVWNKLYKRELFKLVRFEEKTVYEDIVPNYRIMSVIKKFVKTTQPLYYYFENNNSITRNKLSIQDFQLLKVCDEVINYSQELGNKKVMKYALLKKYRSYFSLLAKGLIYGYSDDIKNSKEVTYELVLELRKHRHELLKSKLTLSRKVLIFLVCISPSCLKVVGECLKMINFRKIKVQTSD